MAGADYPEDDWRRFLDLPKEAPSLSYIFAEARAKRTRSKNWSADEKRAYLEAYNDVVRTVKGKPWKSVSQRLCGRSAKECEYLWGTLLKDFRAICRHEKLKDGHRASTWKSYFEMDELLRSKNKFLPLELYRLMERIQEERKKRSRSTTGVPSHAEHSGNGSHAIAEEDIDAQLYMEQRPESSKEQVEDDGEDIDAQLWMEQRPESFKEQVEDNGEDIDAQLCMEQRPESFKEQVEDDGEDIDARLCILEQRPESSKEQVEDAGEDIDAQLCMEQRPESSKEQVEDDGEDIDAQLCMEQRPESSKEQVEDDGEDIDAQLCMEQRLKLIVINLKEKVVDAVNFRFESLRTSPGSADELNLTLLTRLCKPRIVESVISMVQILAVTGFVFDEDDPTVDKYIVDAVNTAFGPVSSQLKALELKKLEAEKRRQVIEAKRKALDLEEMEIEKEQQRVGRHIQRTKKASGSTQQGLRRRRIPLLGFVPERHYL
ncbi:hypothetical protein M758_3G218600 [Ceratodon purpureus]|nr:hypothetical protein M758_3G218600 [Ceratodon purpureus]